jgi:hypothetical protein
MSLFKGASRSLVRAAGGRSRLVWSRAASSMTIESQQKVGMNSFQRDSIKF